ncbi:MAG: carboxymuconolactone decarboxylase family protein [Longimicrobiales bacterium]|nr:carboxymuconolactone decarboxylase family protein [Longimicrobiales bacterium]
MSAFIRYVRPEEQAPEDRVEDSDNIVQIHSVSPPVMKAHEELYLELMHRGGPLHRREREMIAVRVSALNDCPY